MVGIHFNPAPDAGERLRRLFTKLVVDDPPVPGTDPSPDDDGEG